MLWIPIKNESKSPIWSKHSAWIWSFSFRASAETLVLLKCAVTCFKHDWGTPGKIYGGWLGLFPPLTDIQSQSKWWSQAKICLSFIKLELSLGIAAIYRLRSSWMAGNATTLSMARTDSFKGNHTHYIFRHFRL